MKIIRDKVHLEAVYSFTQYVNEDLSKAWGNILLVSISYTVIVQFHSELMSPEERTQSVCMGILFHMYDSNHNNVYSTLFYSYMRVLHNNKTILFL